MAYRSPDLESAVRHLREAVAQNIAAGEHETVREAFLSEFHESRCRRRATATPAEVLGHSEQDGVVGVDASDSEVDGGARRRRKHARQSGRSESCGRRANGGDLARIRRAGKVRFALGQSEMKALRGPGYRWTFRRQDEKQSRAAAGVGGCACRRLAVNTLAATPSVLSVTCLSFDSS